MTQDLSLPVNRDENWRYAALRGIAKLDWSQPAPALTPDQLASLRSALPTPRADTLRLVLCGGRLVTELSDLDDTARLEKLGVSVHRQPSHFDDALAATPIDQRFAVLNRRYAQEVLHIDIARRATPASLDILCFNAGISHPAIEIVLQDGAEAAMTERQLDNPELSANTRGPRPVGPAAATNLRLEITLGRAARLDYARLGQGARHTHHLETLHGQLGDDAQLHLTQVTLGGASTRSTVFIDHGARSQVVWNATALAYEQQVHDHYVRTHHLAPGASTRQLFRGIASDRGRISFNGHMQVAADALQSDLQQSLKCLLDGTTAEANVRPQLEIYTDAVTASHGATVGKLDRDMMFYLLSRGIDPKTAESLLKWAFVSDVLAKLPLALRREMELALLDRLPGAIAAHA